MTGVRQSIDRLLERRRESRDLVALQAELEKLRTQNDRMRDAMRRCVTCDYRLGAAADRTVETDWPTSASSGEEGPARGIPVELGEEVEPEEEGAQG